MCRGGRHFSGVHPVFAVLNMAPQVRFDTSPGQKISGHEPQQQDYAACQPGRICGRMVVCHIVLSL